MIAFELLSPLARALFALWALLLCLSALGSAMLAAVKRRLLFSALGMLLLAPVYLLWQVIFDLSLFRGTETLCRISAVLGGLPWVFWLGALLLFTLAALILLGYNIRFDRTFITPGAIKIFLDRIPCGVCCWRESGQVLFSNICMNRLCAALTGEALLNGNQFSEEAGGIRAAEGRVWRFSRRELTLRDERLHEMIASDITAEYAKTVALEKDKAELSALNRALREYYGSIDETVRRQEILQAKVNIHDEMNRLMLSTMAAESADAENADRIFSLWERNALLLCMEANDPAGPQAADRLEKLAAALKIRLIRHGEPPASLGEKERALFFSAAQEAIANAAKHAAAKTVEIAFEKTETAVICRFINDGNIPAGAVRFAGGLANLAAVAGKMGAALRAANGETFTLTLTFPKNQPNG